jgi:hypothetical protein
MDNFRVNCKRGMGVTGCSFAVLLVQKHRIVQNIRSLNLKALKKGIYRWFFYIKCMKWVKSQLTNYITCTRFRIARALYWFLGHIIDWSVQLLPADQGDLNPGLSALTASVYSGSSRAAGSLLMTGRTW